MGPGFMSPVSVHVPTNTASFLCSGTGFGASVCASEVIVNAVQATTAVASRFIFASQATFLPKITRCKTDLPITPMRRRALLELQFPLVAPLRPYRTPVLVARRRSLILRRRHLHDYVVGDYGNVFAHFHDFHVVGHQVRAAR